MSDKLTRELTTLEYVVLGLIGVEPQSGYSLINFFEEGMNRWSASPGSIYPMLKRLEKQDVIAGELEIVYETRPRKMYTLTDFGEELLDAWLRAPLDKVDVSESRDVLQLKFLYMESRFTPEEVIAWLQDYERNADQYVSLINLTRNPDASSWSTHQQLVVQASIMELEMQRNWLQLAQKRIQARADRLAKRMDQESEQPSST